MERGFKFDDVMNNARNKVQAEVAVNKEAAFRTVAAFVAVTVEAKVHLKVTAKADRQAMIKKTMIRADMSNGKAAAYSKVVELIVTSMIAKYGQPDGATVSQFWASWRDAADVTTLEGMARRYMNETCPADSMGALCDACGVAYGSNKTAQGNAAALAKLNRPEAAKAEAAAAKAAKALEQAAKDKAAADEKAAAARILAEAMAAETVAAMAGGREAVLAQLLNLSDDDQLWVLKALHATKAAAAPAISKAA